MPAAHPISVPTDNALYVVAGPPCLLYGWALTGGAATAVPVLYDGQDATGQLICEDEATSGQAVIRNLGPNGLWLGGGLAVQSSANLAVIVMWVYVLRGL